MDKLTILVDMDDTLVNLIDAWVTMLNRTYGTTVKPNNISAWNMALSFPELTTKQINAPLFTDDLWENVQPHPGAVESLKKLILQGHRVVVITAANPEELCCKTRSCLYKHFPFLTYKDIIATTQKDLIRGDVFIDDAPHNFVDSNGNLICQAQLKILMTAPHNRWFEAGGHGIVRTERWDDIYSLIQAYRERVCNKV